MGMKWRVAMLTLAGALVSGGALAHHGHWHVGVGIGFGTGYGYGWPGYGYGYGGPWSSPYPYPYAYGYPYPYYSQPSEPPVYVERSDASASNNNWWHYCPESKTFYPYVKECPAGWQRVSPTPPDVKERNR